MPNSTTETVIWKPSSLDMILTGLIPVRSATVPEDEMDKFGGTLYLFWQKWVDLNVVIVSQIRQMER